ncbi:TBP-associated factor 15 isoform 1 [Hibiscus syriacus]|uniref:TBP-associated factor 15 isoform 1 n=1 Tax=Hibiscus syriacus TaxID=106335 RepID=A0A6A2X069_HIBSY|nr:CRAL-TRIO domain-containing protein YKL091C-like [Hibiscus syriacus]KAE8667708.1 TBP-associated factor 15 isoform 1 [Hibiscus syriacus]
MEKSHELKLTQMRKLVEKLGFSAERYGDPTLMRFLIARSMDTDKASKIFVQWLKWRSSLVPNGFIAESEVPDQLEARKIYLQGLSKAGYPVMIIQACKHYPPKDHVQFKKFVVYLLDKTIASGVKGREIGNEKLIGVLDFQNITYKNVDARSLITGFQFLQAYFPERLAKCYIVNMPRFFVSVWRMVSSFIEKATLQKIAILTNEDEKKTFIEEIGEEVMPVEYGGKANLRAIQDVEVPPLEG